MQSASSLRYLCNFRPVGRHLVRTQAFLRPLPIRQCRPEPCSPRITPAPQSCRYASDKAGTQADKKVPDNGNPSSQQLVSTALAQQQSPDLVAPVKIPRDPDGVLSEYHPAMSLLNNSAIVIQRQIEMMNVFLGYEQANRYVIMNGRGETIGYLAEEDHGIGQTVKRQLMRTHRSFTAHVFDTNGREVLRIHRPFAFITSRIRIYDPITSVTSLDEGSTSVTTTQLQSMALEMSPSTSKVPLDQMKIIGECKQILTAIRRKYELFTFRPSTSATNSAAAAEATLPDAAIEHSMNQFALIDSPFLSWDFSLRNNASNPIGSVSRDFSGFAREIFTDTGIYVLRMDSVIPQPQQEAGKTPTELLPREGEGLTLDQRAIMLATAVSIDFDYFSRHSGSGGMGFMPLWIPGMGGGAAEAGAAGGAAAGAAGEAGAVGAGIGAAEAGGAAAGAVGRGAVGAAGEAGAAGMAGAGTMAGYEAMQRGMGRGEGAQTGAQGGGDDASPVAPEAGPAQGQEGDLGQWQQSEGGMQGEETWGTGSDPFEQGGGAGSGGGGDGEGGGWISTLWDMFSD